MTYIEETEPKVSASSPQADVCECDHMRGTHLLDGMPGCAFYGCKCAAFRLQEPPMTPEEEERAPEDCAHIGSRETGGQSIPPRWSDFHCDDCGASWRQHWDRKGEPSEPLEDPYEGEQGNCLHGMEPETTRRPPYAVQYTAGDRAYEALLPGDCTIRLTAGGLLIEHPQGVDSLTVVAPVERAS